MSVHYHSEQQSPGVPLSWPPRQVPRDCIVFGHCGNCRISSVYTVTKYDWNIRGDEAILPQVAMIKIQNDKNLGRCTDNIEGPWGRMYYYCSSRETATRRFFFFFFSFFIIHNNVWYFFFFLVFERPPE